MTPKRILFLMSDTGGGHRSAAQAIVDALEREFPGKYATQLVDAIARAALPPFNHMPDWYLPVVTYAEPLWDVGFRSTNRPPVIRSAQPLLDVMIGIRLRRVLRAETPDLVVSVHPLLTAHARRSLRAIGSHAPFVVVVTDLFTAHGLWFDPKADLTLVPTAGTDAGARRYGVPGEKLRVVGLPVSLKFLARGKGKAEQRAQLGLVPDKMTALMVGGGEGMGKVYETARAIAQARLPLQLVVIAGRNKTLKEKLDATDWEIPVSVQGFVTNMPDWMHAADVLITKAGPGTIMEGLACGLPILLNGYLPGQESGNVTFVEQSGVGLLREEPEEIARTLGEWLMPINDTLARFSARARELARPGAALDIAAILDDILTSRETGI
ncbi:MAG: glycosyltransferase [Chloroflexi bacterium]|nr:glycosyltransferase [Chloroflexota bacterium]